MKPGTLAPDPPRLGWRDAVATLRSEPAHTRILGGSIIMLLGSGLVSVVNFGYNVAVARMLGPTAFGHAAAAVTLLMLVSAITLSFQLVCAKLVAKTDVKSERAAVYSSLLKQSWGVGLVLGSALLLASLGRALASTKPPGCLRWQDFCRLPARGHRHAPAPAFTSRAGCGLSGLHGSFGYTVPTGRRRPDRRS